MHAETLASIPFHSHTTITLHVSTVVRFGRRLCLDAKRTTSGESSLANVVVVVGVVVLAHLFYAAPGALASVATAPGVLDQLGFQFFKIGVEVPKE